MRRKVSKSKPRERIDLSQYDMFRRPDWRHERVLTLRSQPEGGSKRVSPHDDNYIRQMKKFLGLYEHVHDDEAHRKLQLKMPGPYFAHECYDRRNGSDRRFAVTTEARLLTTLPMTVIAKDSCTAPTAVEWYEKIYFNVRDRLHAHDWIVNHVLVPAFIADRVDAVGTRPPPQPALAGPVAAQIDDVDGVVAIEQQNVAAPVPVQVTRRPQAAWPGQRLATPYFDSTLKFFAYFGGHILLDYVLSGFRRGRNLTDIDQLGQWLDMHFTNKIKHRSCAAAQHFEVNQRNVMRLFETHVMIMGIEKNADNAGAAENMYSKCVAGLFDNMKWTVGDAGVNQVAGTDLEIFDNSAVELRDGELQQLNAKLPAPTTKGLERLKLPPPRAGEDLLVAIEK